MENIEAGQGKLDKWDSINLAVLAIVVAVMFGARLNDPTFAASKFNSKLADSEKVVRLGPIDHRFAYYYETPITQIDWPTVDRPLPPDAEYLCSHEGPATLRSSERSDEDERGTRLPVPLRSHGKEVASINCNRVIRDSLQTTIVLGRVTRRLWSVSFDVTQPLKRKQSAVSLFWVGAARFLWP